MASYRFVHCADLHLASPFKGLTKIAPDVANTLLEATFEAYDEIIELCISEKVDALLVAGDIFDSADKSIKAQMQFLRGLTELSNHDIKSFVCHGNHDPLNEWGNFTFPDSCTRFGSEVSHAKLVPSDPNSPTVYGYSYPIREVRENIVPQFESIFANDNASIGLLHANVGADTGHESYAPCNISDLNRVGINYWALGHVHTRNKMTLADNKSKAVYPGNTQGRHIIETGAKGVYIVEMSEDGQILELIFKPVDKVRWANIEVNVANLNSLEDIESQIGIHINDQIDESDGRHLIYRVALTGTTTLHLTLSTDEFRTDERDQLNSHYLKMRPFAYCDRVDVKTRQDIDKERYAQGEDFIGDMLRIIQKEKCELKVSDLEDLLPELHKHNKLRKYISYNQGAGIDLEDLLNEVESLCLDLLVSEDINEN